MNIRDEAEKIVDGVHECQCGKICLGRSKNITSYDEVNTFESLMNDQRDYWKRRYEVAREVAIEFARKIYYAEPSQGQIVVDEEIERRIKENK